MVSDFDKNMTTFNITGSISTNDPISASYVAAANIDGVVASSSVAVSASYAPSSGGGINGMVYATTSSIWTIPDGVKKVRVIVIGGGGGAGSYAGGGGGYAESVVSVEGFSTLPIVIGRGGNTSLTGSDGNMGSGVDSGFMNVTGSGGGSGIYGNGGGGSGQGTIVGGGQSGGNSGNGGAAGNLPWIVPGPQNVQTVYKGQGGGTGLNGQSGVVVLYF
jgi:hypothetical protein